MPAPVQQSGTENRATTAASLYLVIMNQNNGSEGAHNALKDLTWSEESSERKLLPLTKGPTTELSLTNGQTLNGKVQMTLWEQEEHEVYSDSILEQRGS